MPLPSVLGSEIEYGITVQGDPDFDPISSCVLLVNAYQDNEGRPDTLGLRAGEPARRCARLPRRGREVHAQPAGEHRAQQDAPERRALLRRPRAPGSTRPRSHQRPRSDRVRARGRAHHGGRAPRGDGAPARGSDAVDPQEQQRPQGKLLRQSRELPDRAPHAVPRDRRAHDSVPDHAQRVLRRRESRQREPRAAVRVPDQSARGLLRDRGSRSTRW